MNSKHNRFALGACFVALACASVSADAIIGVAPGGSVVRRHAIEATAVTTTAVAASSANANAAAAANANAQAAAAKQAQAPAPAPAAATGGAPPIGAVVSTLPTGCAKDTLNNVEYQRCGTVYYRAAMQGSNLVYVVSQP